MESEWASVENKWILPADIRRQMLEHGRDCYPEEGCGLLFGTNADSAVKVITSYLPVANTSPAPLHRFELAPAEWVRSCFDPALVGIFHTHPTSKPVPSPEDLKQLQHFAAQIRLYFIGSPAGDEKPPGKPDGWSLNAYSIVREADGRFALQHASVGRQALISLNPER
ncbi:M67 family metallopeptidase [Paenibacillus macerans]|uniref:M67 family metallopeptidase n=1 Tax=Paenibacillus macerans TaxID=44252 RepID=UPI0025595090|nr:M67 family metallopeptidase [Paenibacillus macerans]